MRILRIRIRNLASLDGLSTIDFTTGPLCTAGIFAITGPTGAGKSTILDALCLALYGKTPRYLQAKEQNIEVSDVQGSFINQGDVRGILRDGSSEGYAEVDFAAMDGQGYQATWKVRRARNRADGALQATDVLLKNLDTGAAIPGKKAELYAKIEQLVGLNFEQFTRSVLLAQGDFTAFLRAAKDDKSSLLEKLTGTQIYSRISKQVYENHARAKAGVDALSAQREGIPTLNATELEELQKEQADFEETIAKTESETRILTSELEWHTRLRDHQDGLTAAEADVDDARQAKLQTADRELQLRIIEKVQPTRGWMQRQETISGKMTILRENLGRLESELSGLDEQSRAATEKEQLASDTLRDKTDARREANPLLQQARALDVQVGERADQLRIAGKETADASELQHRHQQYLAKLRQERTELADSIEALTRWTFAHAAYQSIAGNRGLIAAKLRDGVVIADALKALEPQLEAMGRNLGQARTTLLTLQTETERLGADIRTSESLKASAEAELGGSDIRLLEADRERADGEINELTAAEAVWKIYSQLRADLESLNERLNIDRNAVPERTKQTDEALALLNDARIARDASQQMLGKAKLAANESVEKLRLRLVAGEPCPVCGSKDHPYVSENPALDHVLAELEKAHLALEEDYAGRLARHSALQEAGKQLGERIRAQEEEYSRRRNAFDGQQAEWEKCPVYPALGGIAADRIPGWFSDNLAMSRSRQRALQQRQADYSEKKSTLEAIQKALQDLERAHQSASARLQDLGHSIRSMEDRLEQYNSQHATHAAALHKLESELAGMIPDTAGFGDWKADPDGFGRRAEEAANDWNTKSQKLETALQQQAILEVSVNTAMERAEQSADEARKRVERSEEICRALEDLKRQRSLIFDGQPANDAEDALDAAIRTAKDRLAAATEECETLQLEIGKAQTRKQMYETEAQDLQEEGAGIAAQIQSWLTTYNADSGTPLTEAGLGQLLRFDAEWIRTENDALRAIVEMLATKRTIFEERSTRLAVHRAKRLSERDPEELLTRLEVSKAGLRAAVEARNGIEYRLRQHRENLERIAGLLDQIEAQSIVAGNWGKLNDIIGSADGKKFRQVAQEYTLDVLLDYANVHLEMLSKRYVLQRIPGTLALQVLDRDMGDEIRTVFSLSGGESFLVSLALALGLASLSSNRMQVESLFIDEGFGSLDPATLNIAMDALERLHNQGRKVGVISHVQEMTERIPVQIRVSKQTSGKSKVEIVG